MATELPGGAVLSGGSDGPGLSPTSTVTQGPAETAHTGGVAAGPFPLWAQEQLARAVAVAAAAPADSGIARILYREWFNPVAGPVETPAGGRPLAGVYRAAHAGSSVRVRAGGVSVLGRYDLLGPDGWWRTWGTMWTPPRTRPGSIRLMLTPEPSRLAELVSTITGALLNLGTPWSLGVATSPRRIARYGGAVLDLARLDHLPAGLLDDIASLVRPVSPPLSLPIADGVGLAEYPDNGMTFGEHRCHLVALALRHPSGARDPLRSIAAVFNAHGIDPAAPHRHR